MKSAVLVTPMTGEIPVIEDAVYIGVDAGALKILEQGLPLYTAIGDFDSMEPKELQKLRTEALIDIHPVMKDETDSELAIMEAQKLGCNPIYLIGALGGRLDHTLANLRLMCERFPQVILISENEIAFCLTEGTWEVSSFFKHVSFFALQESIVTFKGFLYPLLHRTIKVDDIFTISNEILEDNATVEIEKGKLLCIQSGYK